MFSNTANGANANATLYSLIETAKANALDPNKYRKMLLGELPKRNVTDGIDDLALGDQRLGAVGETFTVLERSFHPTEDSSVWGKSYATVSRAVKGFEQGI